MKYYQRKGLKRTRVPLLILLVGLVLLAIAARLLYNQGSIITSSKPPKGAPSITQPTSRQVQSYNVAPLNPRYITIAKYNVTARVKALGVTKNNQLQSPANVYDTGWYNASAHPGGLGAVLIDGHVSSWKTKGVFYHLKGLVAGDTIQVERGDGHKFTYQVVRKTIYDAERVDMTAAQQPVVPGTAGLNLITCSGDVIPGTNKFNKRIVVYAKQV